MHNSTKLKISYPLKYIQFDLTFLAVEDINFKNFSGSAIRGTFGWALRQTACVTGLKDCISCPLYGNCVFAYVFDTPTLNRNGLLQKTPFAPHPFVIDPPNHNIIIHQGEKFEFKLTLFGKAFEFLPYFLKSFEILGTLKIANGRAHLLYAHQDGHIFYAGGKILSSPVSKEINFSKLVNFPESHKVTLKFVTPTKLIYKGKLDTDPEFSTIIKSIVRRLNWLTQFHSIEPKKYIVLDADLDEVKKIYSLTKLQKIRRYSTRKKQKMQFKSFTGEIVYEGKDIWKYYPILKAGEIIHVGKATSFGFGKIKIS